MGSVVGVSRLIPKLVILTEIIAPYRIPVFNALARRPEIDLHVIFLSENDPTLREWRIYKDEIKFQHEVLSSRRLRFGGYGVLLNRGLSASLNRVGPDALLCGGYNYLASWQAAYWATVHRVPLLLWSESTALDQRRGHPTVEFLKSKFLSLCRAFVVPGKSSFEYLQGFGIDNQRIFIAPNAVDNELFAASAETARRHEPEIRSRHSLPTRYFLFVGRLVRAKGVFDLIEAYGKLSDEIRAKVGLLFVGDGPDRAALQHQAAHFESVQFAGFVHREELPEFYALADALIFPTHSDTWGLVVNEAMACGLPVISTKVAGCAADLLEEGCNGTVTSPGSVSELASAMARLAEDSTRRKEMASRSIERIANYSPEAWADGLVKTMEYLRARRQ